MNFEIITIYIWVLNGDNVKCILEGWDSTKNLFDQVWFMFWDLQIKDKVFYKIDLNWNDQIYA